MFSGVFIIFTVFEVLKSEFCRLARKIFLNHKGNLEGYCVVKLTKVKSCKLSDLLKTVHESVSVYEELS